MFRNFFGSYKEINKNRTIYMKLKIINKGVTAIL